MLFQVFVIGHLLGDFYFQSDELLGQNKKSTLGYIRHYVVYFVTLFTLAALTVKVTDIKSLFVGIMFISFIHWIIDGIKSRTDKLIIWQQRGHIVFLVTQLMHLIVIYLVIYIAGVEISSTSLLCKVSSYPFIQQWITPVLAGFICWKPASVFVALVFETIPKTITQAEQPLDCEKEDCPYYKQNEEGAKIGSWIGVLEREIILVLGIMGQFGAIGFVLTAKSLARYKQLENKAFAEKYLVGTLISAIISILCVVICSV